MSVTSTVNYSVNDHKHYNLKLYKHRIQNKQRKKCRRQKGAKKTRNAVQAKAKYETLNFELSLAEASCISDGVARRKS